MAGPVKSLEEKFWSKVDRRGPDDCWLWLGALAPTTERAPDGTMRRHSDAYGHMGVWRDGRWTTDSAHRISYRLATGYWPPPGKHVAHHCDVRRCCNPAHLFLTDNAGNIADMVAKGRQHRGEGVGNNKMTDDRVRALRAAYSAGTISQAALGKQFGISQTVVGDIVRRDTWTHVT